MVVNEDFLGLQGRVRSFSTRIDNEHGSWMGTGRGYVATTQRYPHAYLEALYRGAGAYEGLTAIIFAEYERGSGYDYHGMIFPGEVPEVPAMPERKPE
jgi:hypothetical protein